MFYVIIFSILAVVLVVGGVSGMSRRRKALDQEEHRGAKTKSARQNRKRQRSQSRHDRRKRH
jgi:hypothetical protein